MSKDLQWCIHVSHFSVSVAFILKDTHRCLIKRAHHFFSVLVLLCFDASELLFHCL